MLSVALAESADGERLRSDDIHARAMKMSSLALLRAVERARGLYVVTKPAPLPRIRIIPAIPGLGLGESVIRAVAAAYEITPETLLTRCRASRMVCARSVAAKLLRDLKWADGSQRFSYPQIGRMLDGLDHPFMRAVYDELRGGE
jgi:hypothetical protein